MEPKQNLIDAGQLEHSDLVGIMQGLQYEVSPGKCHGFSMMTIQAILAEEFNEFKERIKFLARNKKSLKESLENQRDQNSINIRAFFDGIDLYHQIESYPEIRKALGQYIPAQGESHDARDYEIIISKLTQSKKLEDKGGIVQVAYKGATKYSVDAMKEYLDKLAEIIDENNLVNIPILLQSSNHSIVITYINKNWYFADINFLFNDVALEPGPLPIEKEKFKRNTMYLEKDGDALKYTMLNEKNTSQNITGKITEKDLPPGSGLAEIIKGQLNAKGVVDEINKNKDLRHNISNIAVSRGHYDSCLIDRSYDSQRLATVIINRCYAVNRINAPNIGKPTFVDIRSNVFIAANQVNNEKLQNIQKRFVDTFRTTNHNEELETLRFLIKTGQPYILEGLLAKFKNLKDEIINNQLEYLKYAVESGRIEMVDYFLKGKKEDEVRRLINLALQMAVNQYAYKPKMVGDLLSKGADPNQDDPAREDSLLMATIKNGTGKVALVEILLDHRADVNKKDSRGFTPIYHTICSQSQWAFNKEEIKEVVNMLLDRGADVSITYGKDKKTLSQIIEREFGNDKEKEFANSLKQSIKKHDMVSHIATTTSYLTPMFQDKN